MNPGVNTALLPSGKVKDYIWIGVAVVVLIIVLLLIKQGSKLFSGFSGMFDNVFSFFGAGADDKAADTALNNADPFANTTASPFNPTFYKSAPGGTPLMTSANAAKLADQIYNSVGVFYDDPESGFAAFKQCRNWAMVSQLCDMFETRHDKDAYSFLKIKYDTTSQKDVLAKIVNYCKALPKY